MNNQLKSIFTWIFILTSILLISVFLYFSNRLVNSLEEEEYKKMEIWANAYSHIFSADSEEDISLELKIIESNNTIPVFFTNENKELLGSNNLKIPTDTIRYVSEKVRELEGEGHYFEIELSENEKQYLYFDESVVLHQLQYYPYIQILIILVFAFLFYYMIVSRKQYEQNRVWVGLSKETAHQLGTPIQSLMGWSEYFESIDYTIDKEQLKDVVSEINKDISRLHIVADRFSKIGSEPKLEEANIGKIIESVASYMQKRVSGNISIITNITNAECTRPVCVPLFAWVIENICKNAVDAISSDNQNNKNGMIVITLYPELSAKGKAVIDIEDNGRGIAKNKLKTIFEPGYTTKKRGWGLGLALVKRIVEQYHHGKVFVKASAEGKGSIFRIEI